ncbi:MAG: zinc-ribbon and DUF3426 domain-containing protein, partial [Gammaproteobacteria bacterium]|nr:zinc-ribbon and DUF3426 domain-containing protein [Gammaproteobacteria bacterium]
MSNSVQLSDTLQTTCPNCGSIFRLSPDHLEMARGQVRCSECMQTFNALLSLKNYSGEFDNSLPEINQHKNYPEALNDNIEHSLNTDKDPSVSLNQAMYGENYTAKNNFKPLLLIAGILLLLIIAIVQIVYYQRYSLISSAHYQQQILSLCQVLPCDESRFTSLSQIKLLERNIFTHPTRKHALMVSGSFVNQAPFRQAIPKLLISLSDTQGNFIANRLFKAEEFLADKSLHFLKPGKPVQFR